MQTQGKTPFPENATCKQCLSRPCNRLFTGRAGPGKMVFVHRREMKSLSVFKSGFVGKDGSEDTAAALTDELAAAESQEKTPVQVTNPRWEHVDEDKKENSPDVASVGDTVKLFVDVKGVPEGISVTFDVFDTSASPPFRIGSASGKNEGGVACGEWVVEDPGGQGAALKLEFDGNAKSKASERAELPVKIIKKFVFSC